MANAFGIPESIVHAPYPGKKYAYRAGKGMFNNAEWYVFHDDFDGTIATNVPLGWTAAIIDTGCTATLPTTGTNSGGILLFDSDADNEGVAIYGLKRIYLGSKRFFMEVRVKQEDVSAQTFQFGLTDVSATTDPEDMWDTSNADGIAFGNLDAATVTLTYDKDNGGPVANAGDSSIVLLDDTWHTLAISYNGAVGTLQGWVDGDLAVTAATTAQVPNDILLAPFIGMLAGHATTADICEVDWVRIVMER